MNKLELLEKRSELLEQMKLILNSAKTQKRELLKVEDKEFRDLQNQINELDKKINNNNKNQKPYMENITLFRALQMAHKGEEIAGQEELRNRLKSTNFEISSKEIILDKRAVSPVGGENVTQTLVAPVAEQLEETSFFTKIGAKRVSIAADYVLPALSNAALSFDYEDGEETADAGFQLGAKKLVLKRLSGYVPIDNRVLTLNSDGSLENAIVASLYKIADAKKAADLFTNDLSGVTEITVGTTNYEKIVGLEAELLAKGIDGASLVYVYHPSMLPKLKANEKKVNGITEPILKDGMIGGIKAVVTTACPADKIYLMAGTEVWDNTAAFTLSLDENTLSHKGQSRIVCNIYTDEKISRNEFAAFTTLA